MTMADEATRSRLGRGLASLIGDMTYKYCINTAGTYVPLLGEGA